MPKEALVAMAHRHVREGDAHIKQQQGIIDRLVESDLPTKEARDLLARFEAIQAEHRRHLSQIVEQQQSGERDGHGNLVTRTGAPLT